MREGKLKKKLKNLIFFEGLARRLIREKYSVVMSNCSKATLL